MSERGKIFKESPIIAPNRSWFDMSYDNTFSMNLGELVPCCFLECLPGDHFKAKTNSMVRLAPMVAPVMGQLNQFSYHFAVRLRDIWTQFDKFITNNDQRRTWQSNISNFTPPTMPYFKPKEILYDKLGETAVSVDLTNTDKLYFGQIYGYLLLISYNLTTHKYSYVVITRPHNVTLDTANYQYWWFVFKPNTTEYQYQDEQGIGLYRWKKNPFCPGSLMDYLGIDIMPMYKLQQEYYDDMIGLHTSLSSTPLVTFMSNYDLSDNKEYGTDGMVLDTDKSVQIDFDLPSLVDFFNTHCIAEVGTSFKVSSTYHYACAKGHGLNNLDGTETQLSSFANNDEQPMSALPLRAYRFIYDEYFRDQNYIQVNPLTDFSRDGDEFVTVTRNGLDELKVQMILYLSCEYKAWEHDIYTSVLPGPQRGDAVRFLSDAKVNFVPSNNDFAKIRQTGSWTGIPNGTLTTNSAGNLIVNGQLASVDSHEGLSVDLSAATIENFRWANAMQKYLEKKARTGGRYFEYLLGIWNKSVEDSKLNRPIYLNGEKTPVMISEVLQTSASDVSTGQPLGDMAGRGIAIGNDQFLEYEAPDYCYFIEITAIIPRTAYQSGIAPHFLRENYLDFPLPDFAQLGEEYVKRIELYYTGLPVGDNQAFGYTPRYSQWKYKRSEIHGEFKDTLDFWTFGRKFDTPPVMGSQFINCKPDYRQFAVAVQNYQHCYVNMWHDIQLNRALPEYGVPIL